MSSRLNQYVEKAYKKKLFLPDQLICIIKKHKDNIKPLIKK